MKLHTTSRLCFAPRRTLKQTVHFETQSVARGPCAEHRVRYSAPTRGRLYTSAKREVGRLRSMYTWLDSCRIPACTLLSRSNTSSRCACSCNLPDFLRRSSCTLDQLPYWSPKQVLFGMEYLNFILRTTSPAVPLGFHNLNNNGLETKRSEQLWPVQSRGASRRLSRNPSE